MPCEREIVRIGRQLGKRHVELAKSWIASGAFYGATAAIALVYFTDWKIIADKIPIYNTKFKD